MGKGQGGDLCKGVVIDQQVHKVRKKVGVERGGLKERYADEGLDGYRWRINNAKTEHKVDACDSTACDRTRPWTHTMVGARFSEKKVG